jgi:hypothetical protein
MDNGNSEYHGNGTIKEYPHFSGERAELDRTKTRNSSFMKSELPSDRLTTAEKLDNQRSDRLVPSLGGKTQEELRKMTRRDIDGNVRRQDDGVDECPNCGRKEWTAPSMKGEVMCDDTLRGCGYVKEDLLDTNNPGDWSLGDGMANPGRELPVRSIEPGAVKQASTLTVKQAIKRFGAKDSNGVRLGNNGRNVAASSKRNERSAGDKYRTKMVRHATTEVGSRNSHYIVVFGAVMMDAYTPQNDEDTNDRLGKLPLNQTRHMQKVEKKGWRPPGGYQEKVSATAALVIAGRILSKGYDVSKAIERYNLNKKHVWKEIGNIKQRIGRLIRLKRNLTKPDFASMKVEGPQREIALNNMANFLADENLTQRKIIERVVRLCLIEIGSLSAADASLLRSVKPRALVGVFTMLEFERLGIERVKSGLSRAIDFSVTQMRNTLKENLTLLKNLHEVAVRSAAAA